MARFLRWLVRLILNLIADIEVHGAENIPATGGVVVASNHIGFLDIVMFHYVCDRYDIFVPVGEKWGRRGWIRQIAKGLNLLFVDRFNPDLRAMREMIGLMENGNALVIAPEGTRSRTGALIEGKLGVAYLAARSGFPVVAAAITGSEDKVVLDNLRHFRRTKITLTGGKPFSIPALPKRDRDAALKQDLDEIMCQIALLLPERYRGVYAEHPRLKELLEHS